MLGAGGIGWGSIQCVCMGVCSWEVVYSRLSLTPADVVDPVLYSEANKDLASDNPLPL